MESEKTYTVAEVALILEGKGITSHKSSEQMVRKWIRAYQKEHEKQMLELSDSNKNEEEILKLAHIRASEKGIRAHKTTKKQGYTIKQSDLDRFINNKQTKRLENSINDDFFKVKYKTIEAIRYTTMQEKLDEGTLGEFDKPGYISGFTHGFQAALEYLQERNEENFKSPEQLEKETITFPKDYRWYLNKEDILIKDLRETKLGLDVKFTYKTVPGLTVELSADEFSPLCFKAYCSSGYKYILSPHNKSYLESLFTVNEDTYNNTNKNIKIRKNILTILEAIHEKLRDTNSEYKLFALLSIDKYKTELENSIGEK